MSLAVAAGSRRRSPAAPVPVSLFDFHEGSGSTATSTNGLYTLTADSPSTAWVTGGVSGSFQGSVGPDEVLESWSAAITITLLGEPDGDGWTLLGNDRSDANAVYVGVQGTNVFPSRLVNLFQPGSQAGTARLDIGPECVVVFVIAPGSMDTYINGVHDSTWIPTDGEFTTNFTGPQHVLVPYRNNTNIVVRAAAFYDVTLTADEVAAL